MKNLLIFTPFLIVILCAPLMAEVWECAETHYTNVPVEGMDCNELRSFTVCSADGNRYVTPSKGGVYSGSDSCQKPLEGSRLKNSPSPLVNTAFAEAYKDYKARPTRKWTHDQQPNLEGADFDFEALQKSELGALFQIIGSTRKIMDAMR